MQIVMLSFGGKRSLDRISSIFRPAQWRVFSIFFLLSPLSFFAQKDEGKLNRDSLSNLIDNLVEEAITQKSFPGAQVLVAHKGEIVHHRSYGFHTYQKETSVENHHLYDLASVTKIAAGVPLLMHLVQEELIKLDDPIGIHLKDWSRSNKKEITFRQALAHFARLKPYFVFWQDAQKKNGKYKGRTFKNSQSNKYNIKITEDLYLHERYPKKMFRTISKSDLLDDKKYVYSGLTFQRYPQLVHEKTGMELDSFLYQTFYEKVGADRLCFRPTDRFPKEEIVPTELDTFFRHQLVHGTVHDEAAAMLNGLSCNAGLFSNAGDLAKLCQLFLDGGSYQGLRLIDENVVREFTDCHYCAEGNRRGLGFDKPLIEYDANKSYVAKSASSASFGHSGFTGTFVWMDPVHDFLVVFLSNRVHPYRSSRGLYSSGFRPRLHQAVYDWIANM